MSGIYWQEGEVRVSNYAVAGNKTRCTVMIKLEVLDTTDLGYLIDQLEMAKALPKPKPKPAPLLITDRRGQS